MSTRLESLAQAVLAGGIVAQQILSSAADVVRVEDADIFEKLLDPSLRREGLHESYGVRTDAPGLREIATPVGNPGLAESQMTVPE